ncbi:MAG: metallophosphoesterase [Firmicutes bacterium]|nr:metallophosphoesterase [Bacillota bacterium]
MAIFAIADLHLSFDPRVEKPMEIYGARWQNHAERLEESCKEMINDEDTVLIAGDISWALKQEEAMADLDWVHSRIPGQKVLLKGNHELWWQSVSKLNKLYDDMFFLQNTFFAAEGTAICGTRGWLCPGAADYTEQDEKIYRREALRLEMSLEAARAAGFTDIIGALHYPPTDERHNASRFTEIFEKYGVKHVYYGHLHGKDVWPKGLQGIYNGVEYNLISLDYLDAKPVRIK